jgi:hypothetical protein
MGADYHPILKESLYEALHGLNNKYYNTRVDERWIKTIPLTNDLLRGYKRVSKLLNGEEKIKICIDSFVGDLRLYFFIIKMSRLIGAHQGYVRTGRYANLARKRRRAKAR